MVERRDLKPARLRSSSYGAVHLAIHPCIKLQGILAKANELEEADEGYTGHPTGNLHEFVGFPEIRRLEAEYLPKSEVDRKYSQSIGFQP